MEDSLATDAPAPEDVDVSKAHSARVYDYFLGGKNHFAADREVADKVLADMPSIRTSARENRAFMGRAVRFLVEEAGIRQFLDIGTGLPTTGSAHEIAQSVEPATRVVYADNDPLVLVHAQALLTSSPEGRTAYIHADLQDPETLLADPVVREVIDFGQPVGLLLVAILHFLVDEEKPEQIIATLLDALPSGSYLVATHSTAEHAPRMAETPRSYARGGIKGQHRDATDFARLAFSGLELVPPGVVLVSEWRPTTKGPRPSAGEVSVYGGVARKG